MKAVPQITARDAQQRWSKNQPAVLLLDVREPDELKVAQINGAHNIPMSELPKRLDELNKQQEIIVSCHHGGRSQRVAEFLVEQGFTNVHNLAGGIDAWSRDVDPQVPRY